MASAMAMAAPSSLAFAASESKVAGMLTPLRKLVPEKIREICHKERQLEHDNAPRIVGATKIGMDVAVALTGNPFLITYAAFAICGRMISIIYGSKAHQKKLAQEKADGQPQVQLKNTLKDNDRKILHPREYPVEASAGLSVIAETFGVWYGVSKFMAGATGFTPLITGLIAVWSYGNIVFKKEKKREEGAEAEQAKGKSGSLTLAASESKVVGATGKLRKSMKGNPVLVSSMVNVGICTAMLVGGIIEGLPVAYAVASVVGGFANLLQGLLVRKNDYNVEGATQDKTEATASATFQERVAAAKGRGGDLGMQPA